MTNEVKELHEIISALILEIEDLKNENKELKQRLSRYETPKNSSNSSIPPSKDENRPRAQYKAIHSFQTDAGNVF